MSAVIDWLDFPEGTRTAKGPLERYARFPLAPDFTVGSTGTVQVPNAPDAAGWRLVLEHATPRFINAGQARLESPGPSLFRVHMGPAAVLFRVVADRAPRLGWPAGLVDDALGRVAPGVQGLDVLADLLLERQHPLGARLRGLPDASTDDEWQGELPLLVQHGRLDLSFARGLVVAAVVRGLKGLDRLSAHVLTHLVQQVELLAWSDAAPTRETMSAALDALLSHRLPWLGRLRVHGLEARVGDGLQRLWRQGRWRALVAADSVLETPAPAPLVLKTATRVDAVPTRGFMPVGDGSPLCFVRLRHATCELTVARPAFTLEKTLRARTPGEQSPWVVPLKPGDTFFVDERAYTIDLA